MEEATKAKQITAKTTEQQAQKRNRTTRKQTKRIKQNPNQI